jgi:hypothetical protein
MGFSATESGLKLDDRISPLASESLDHRSQKMGHPIGDEGPSEKQNRILIFRPSGLLMDPREVGRKFGLLKGSLSHILVGNGRLSPGLQGHALLRLFIFGLI